MLLLFDLDGVLVDFKDLHKRAFILSWNLLNSDCRIDTLFHRKYLEGLPTKKKVEFCSQYFNIPILDTIYIKKQSITLELLKIEPINKSVRETIQSLKKDYTLGCCSNSIRNTVMISLERLNIQDCFTCILSNEDINNPKPSPDIYIKAMKEQNVSPSDCIIFEDSPVGIKAAIDSGAHVIQIVDSLDITYPFLKHCIRYKTRLPVEITDPTYRINLVIPMAGLGSRFQKEGYIIQKPFLPVFGKKMYSWVIENMLPKNPALRSRIYTYIIIREDQQDNLKELKTDSSITVCTVPGLTEGPACTVLSVKDIINSKYPLIIANSDQYLTWDVDAFYYALLHPSYDGVISVFHQPDEQDIKWSYVKVNSEGTISEVAEKKYISSNASTGIYGWKMGSDFVKHTESMISKNIRVNNEFYVCPVYNEAITQSLNFRIHTCEKMWGLGVPSDYEYFLTNWSSEYFII